MAQTPEGKVKAAVKRYLKSIGAWFYMPVQNGMGVVGIPDFIVCWRGRFFAIETKAPGRKGSVTPNQKRQIEAICGAEGVAVVVDDPTDLPKIFGGEP